MNNKSITPNPQRPVDRVSSGQLPSALAELSEVGTCGPSNHLGEHIGRCSYDGDDE